MSLMAPVSAPMLEKSSLWHLFTPLLIVPSRIIDLKLFDIHDTSFPRAPYKLLPFIKNILGAHGFFLCFYFFHFYRTLTCGLAGAYVNPRFFSNSLFVDSLLCQITHSFLNGFQVNLCQHIPHVCSTCHNIFSLKQINT